MSDEEIIQDLQKRLKLLEDKEQLASFMNYYCRVADDLDWRAWGDCFSEDATFEYTPVGIFTGREAIREGTAGTIMYETTMHYISNVQFEVDGDSAVGTAYLRYAGVVSRNNPENHLAFGGPYRWEYRRSKEGWKITKLKLETCWTNQGNLTSNQNTFKF